MKNLSKYYLSLILCSASFACVNFTSCSDNNSIQVYDNSQKTAIYFNRYVDDKADVLVRADTALIQLNEYPGIDEVVYKFRLSIIGEPYSSDKEYVAYVDDFESTADYDQYSLPDVMTFKGGAVSDSLAITIHSNKVKDKESAYIIVKLKENKNFQLGYQEGKQIKLAFSKIIGKPNWWIDDMERLYLGTYSYEKYLALVAANGGSIRVTKETTDTERRIMALNLKHYIEENHITEKNGSPMIVPIW